MIRAATLDPQLYGEVEADQGAMREAMIVVVLSALAAGKGNVAGGWMLVAMVIVVRQALDDKNTWRALGVCVIGWAIQALVLVVTVSIFGSP